MNLNSVLYRVEVFKLQVSNIIIKKKHYTIAALKDELTRTLSSAAEYNINQQSNHIEIDYKYYRYAHKLLYTINLAKPIPTFEINISDLSRELKQELQELNRESLTDVVIDTISRLYEGVNSDYFHTTGIRGKIKWRFIN
jgi:hypothetical protein